jgi:cbb3-type cytochrome oxidase maturation protein
VQWAIFVNQNMSIIILIAAASILIAGGFLIAFLWGVKDGQFDDNFAPPNRILFDDTLKEKIKK